MKPASSQPPAAHRGATLLSVAKAAGVHRSTAARALNPEQSHLISAEVVERVRAEAHRQEYRRDAIAASLRTGRSRLVGVVVPGLANPVFAPILDGIAAQLASEGYSMLVADGGADEAGQVAIVEALIARRVDGLVLATVRRDDPVLTVCLKARIPTVLVNRREDGLRASSIVSDDIRGMCLAIEHLVAIGHGKIGHLAGPTGFSTGVLRRKGFEDAMTASGLDASAIVVASEYSRAAGRIAAATLLDRRPDLTAIAASNDLLALGALQELKRRDLCCPGDVSIVGYNEMPLVDMVDPPLTTIDIGHAAMGREAARSLLAQIADTGLKPATVLIPARLVLRESTAPPARATPGGQDFARTAWRARTA